MIGSVGVSSCATTNLVKPQIKVDERLIINCEDLGNCNEIPGCYTELENALYSRTEKSIIEYGECMEYDRATYIWLRYKGLLESQRKYNEIQVSNQKDILKEVDTFLNNKNNMLHWSEITLAGLVLILVFSYIVKPIIMNYVSDKGDRLVNVPKDKPYEVMVTAHISEIRGDIRMMQGKINDLHDMHNHFDGDGLPIWYSKHESIAKKLNEIDTKIVILHGEINKINSVIKGKKLYG